MKGLLYKDLVTIWNSYRKNLLFVLAIYTAVAVASDQYPLLYAVVFLMGLYTVSTLSFDEYSHWDTFCRTLPVSAGQVIGAKYLLGLLFMGAGSALSMVLLCATAAARGRLNADALVEYLVGCISALVTILVYYGVTFPVSFKVGAAKARSAVMAVFAALVGAAFVVYNLLRGDPRWAFVGEALRRTDRLPAAAAVLMAAALALYAASAAVSMKIYREKEF